MNGTIQVKETTLGKRDEVKNCRREVHRRSESTEKTRESFGSQKVTF